MPRLADGRCSAQVAEDTDPCQIFTHVRDSFGRAVALPIAHSGPVGCRVIATRNGAAFSMVELKSMVSIV
jgi:hypothetical protein